MEEALNYRRAVRVFDKNKPLDPEKVKRCLELAALAPSSSNMQLWDFFQITRPELIARIAGACLGQSAAATASEIVVFVTRQYLYRQRAQSVFAFERGNIRRNASGTGRLYYGKLMPFFYARRSGVLGAFRSCWPGESAWSH